MGTHMLSTWIKSITGHNNLAYFQSKLDTEISLICSLCQLRPETMIYYLITDCEGMAKQQLNILENAVPLSDMQWSNKKDLLWGQRLINLEVPVLVQSQKSSNIEFG